MGIANATYRPITPIVTTAKNAIGKPPNDFRAGGVMMAAMSDETTTAFTGTRWRLRRDHKRPAGTAPSRLNANIIREHDVRHDVVQYSWPIVEMSITILKAPDDRAVAKMPV